MTRKDYILIANNIKGVMPEEQNPQYIEWYKWVQQMADELEAENPRFDRSKFIKACTN